MEPRRQANRQCGKIYGIEVDWMTRPLPAVRHSSTTHRNLHLPMNWKLAIRSTQRLNRSGVPKERRARLQLLPDVPSACTRSTPNVIAI